MTSRRFTDLQGIAQVFARRRALGLRRRMEDRSFVCKKTVDTVRSARAFLRSTFALAAKETAAYTEGSTGTVAVLSNDGFLSVAHVGDSPAMLFMMDRESSVEGDDLIVPHNPLSPIEKERLDREGVAIVQGSRLFDVDENLWVAMSRAFGDADVPGMGRRPDLTSLNLKPLLESHKHAYLCVASDGILGPYQSGPVIGSSAPSDVFDNAESLCKWVMLRSLPLPAKDNITVMILDLHKSEGSVVLGVFDGHRGNRTAQKVCSIFKDRLCLGPA